MPHLPAAARPLVTALAATALLAFAGCERPTPQVTVFSGTGSEQVEAMCWRGEAGQVAPEDCRIRADRVGTVAVRPGDTVGISVDTAVADDGGWVPTIGGQRLVADPQESTYYRFQLGEQDLRGGPLELRVFAVSGETTRGLWVFRLERG